MGMSDKFRERAQRLSDQAKSKMSNKDEMRSNDGTRGNDATSGRSSRSEGSASQAGERTEGSSGAGERQARDSRDRFDDDFDA